MSDSTPTPNQLPALGLLSGISDEHRSFLACFGKYHRPKEGEKVIVEGEAQDSLYLILSGKLHIITGADTGRPVLLASLGPGGSMGEINLFDPGTASASAVVRSSALIWTLSRAELEAFLDADPVISVAVLRAMLQQLSQRLRAMNEKLASAQEKSSLHEFWNALPQ